MDTLDPTLDFPMLDYLKTGKIPAEYEEKDIYALKLRAEDYYLENHHLR